MKIFITFIIVLSLSCSLPTSDTARTDEEIRDDLIEISLLIPVIEAGLELVDEESVLNLSRSRALSPNEVLDIDSDLMAYYFGGDWLTSPNTPHELFLSHGTTGEILRVPSSGEIAGIYGDGNNDFYLTIESLADTKYRVKLYIYPRNIFNIDYTYEEYIVDESNTDGAWSWDYFNNTGKASSWVKQKTFYRDGTFSNRKTEWVSYSSILTEVKNNAPSLTSAATDIIVNLSLYDFPSDDPVYTNSEGTFSSKTTSLVKAISKGKTKVLKQQTTEYYSEEGDKSFTVLFMNGKSRKDDRESVTRAHIDRAIGETNILSMNTDGDDYTEINRIYKTNTTYSSERYMWSESPSESLNIGVANFIKNDLVKVGDSYTGTLSFSYGSFNLNYSYTIDTLSGEVTTEWLGFSRDISEGLTIDLADLSNISIETPETTKGFNGRYELGSLIGTYSYDDFEAEVEIGSEGLLINDVFYTW